LLNAYHPKVSKMAYEVMTGDGVDVRLSHRVLAVEKDHIVVMNKETKEKVNIPYGICIWASGDAAKERPGMRCVSGWGGFSEGLGGHQGPGAQKVGPGAQKM